MSTKINRFVIVYFDYLYIYLSVHTLRIANEYKLVCLVAGTLSLHERKKTCVDIPTDFGFFLGTRRQTKYLLSPLPPACSTQQPRERETGRERDRKRESYIFNRLIFSLREGKLNTSTLPPTHTRSFFVSFGKLFYFALAWCRKAKKMERGKERMEGKGREERTSPQSFSPFLVRAQAPTESLCNFQSLRIQVLIKAPWGTAHNITLHFQAL